MKIIKTKFFDNQVFGLSKKYKLIYDDIDFFEKDIEIEPYSDLGNGFLKYRIRNSSIPTGKRGGFRIIVKIYGNVILPILIFSKTNKENTNFKEIMDSLEKILKEL